MTKQTTIQEAMELAQRHHQAGRSADAQAIYSQVLAAQPNYPQAQFEYGLALFAAGKIEESAAAFWRAAAVKTDFAEAWNNLAHTLSILGRFEEAIAAARQAIAIKPDYDGAYTNLGSALGSLGRQNEAIAAYHKAIEIGPDASVAHNNLGNILMQARKFDEAIASYGHAIQLKPDYAQAHNNLGNALQKSGRLSEAIDAYQKAITLSPNLAPAYNNLANALRETGKLDEAFAALRRAIELKPDFADAYANLGAVLKIAGRFDDAIAAGKRAIELKPDSPEAYNVIGAAHSEKRQFDLAIENFRRAIELKPDYAAAHGNLGNSALLIGRVDEALDSCRKAVELQPEDPRLGSSLILTMQFHPDCGPEKILAECRAWAARYEPALSAQARPHENNLSPDRRLKLAYVSAELYQHPTANFMIPLLSHHNREQFELFCYSSVKQPDRITDKIRPLFDHWLDARAITDAALAEQIRRDKIDILVDLTLHMGHSRLLTFARRPAPVQVTWLGFPGTTGLTTIGYRLTDPFIDPPGQRDEYYSEKSIRMPHSYYSYDPLEQTPLPNALPALETGRVTFGSFNNFSKVNRATIQLWTQALHAVPNSRLLIKSVPGTHWEAAHKQFVKGGIAPDRVEIIPQVPPGEYFSLFHRVDICLDPIPYCGHTTSFDGCWMGVPVITLAGQTAVGRVGVSILSNLQMTDWIAQTSDEYAQIARQKTGDLAALSKLRSSLRARMQASPLMNPPQFARGMEEAFQKMWTTWCEGKS